MCDSLQAVTNLSGSHRKKTLTRILRDVPGGCLGVIRGFAFTGEGSQERLGRGVLNE